MLPAAINRAIIWSWGLSPELNAVPPSGGVIFVGNGVVQYDPEVALIALFAENAGIDRLLGNGRKRLRLQIRVRQAENVLQRRQLRFVFSSAGWRYERHALREIAPLVETLEVFRHGKLPTSNVFAPARVTISEMGASGLN